jgi:hypothetical protein
MAMETTNAGNQYTGPATDKLSDIGEIYIALEMAAELSKQVRDVVNKLAGVSNQASGAGTALKEVSPNGLLPSLGRDARDAKADMEAAIMALRRLESQLP